MYAGQEKIGKTAPPVGGSVGGRILRNKKGFRNTI